MLGTGSCRILVPGRSLGIRSLCILGVAGRCRIEKGLGRRTGRYCKADFGRRSSSVIHLNTHETQLGLLVTKSMKGIV